MSGVFATLNGIVLTVIKRLVGHGNWGKWIQEKLPKSHQTANKYRRLGTCFPILHPRVQFEQATLALGNGEQSSVLGPKLDMTHPLAAAVAKWIKGRSFYQLREDELKTCGNHHPECPHCGGDLASKSQAICPHCGKETGEKEPTPDEQLEALRATVRGMG